MSNIKLYYHSGSKNHGCEAIVRSTVKIINQPVELFSTLPEDDRLYNVDDIVDIIHDKDEEIKRFSWKHIWSSINIKLFKSELKNNEYKKENFLNQVKKDDVYLSIGGDNYCYAGVEKLSYLNQLIHKKGGKTVLWGCSISPEIINSSVKEDLLRYNLIIARESITYNALKDNGIDKNVCLIPDPAFQLDIANIELPKEFEENNIVGINLSPLICKYEEVKGQALLNYERLIQHILETSNYKVALIPHVVKEESNDNEVLKYLYDKFSNTNKVILIEDCNCMELKKYISKCRLFIGARTHATIAAYSTCVPTLVVGYSVKAKGIAKDIFGTYENYVIPVQSLKNENDLINAYEWIKNNEEIIKKHLNDFMPQYREKSLLAGKKVRELAR